MASERDDNRKDLLLGAAGAVLAATGVSGIVAAFGGTIAALGWNRLAGSTQRRAERLIHEMILADSEPEAFAEELKRHAESTDDETLAAFRSLLFGAMQAVSERALPAMGFIGRKYFRGECALWRARAAVVVLNEFDGRELEVLHRFASEIAAMPGDTLIVIGDTLYVASNGEDQGWYASARGGAGTPRMPVSRLANPDRIFGWLKRSGLAQDTTGADIGGSVRAMEIERGTAALFRDALEAAGSTRADA